MKSARVKVGIERVPVTVMQDQDKMAQNTFLYAPMIGGSYARGASFNITPKYLEGSFKVTIPQRRNIVSTLGTLLSDFKKAGSAIKNALIKAAGEAPTVMSAVVNDTAKLAPLVEQFLPGSAAVVALGEKLLDLVGSAVESAGDAAGESGLSVSLDAQTVADVKAVIAAAKTAKL